MASLAALWGMGNAEGSIHGGRVEPEAQRCSSPQVVAEVVLVSGQSGGDGSESRSSWGCRSIVQPL